jgi:hypothetical protein
MNDKQHQFRSLLGKPSARLTIEQVSRLLGCPAHDLPIPIAGRLLKPLGNPTHNGIKFFSTAEVTDLAKARG